MAGERNMRGLTASRRRPGAGFAVGKSCSPASGRPWPRSKGGFSGTSPVALSAQLWYRGVPCSIRQRLSRPRR